MDQRVPPPQKDTAAQKPGAKSADRAATPPVPKQLPEIRLGRPMPQLDARAVFADLARRYGGSIDLSGKFKAVFLIGRGKSGKTTTARYIAECWAKLGLDYLVLDADKTNPVLNEYMRAKRPRSYDDDSIATWIADETFGAIGTKIHVLVDLGGGDTALGVLVERIPGFVADIEAAGGAVIACCTLGSSVDDLGPLANLHAVGFRPTATALLLSEASLTTPINEASFAAIQAHSFYKEMIANQRTVPILVPALQAAQEVELRRMNFGEAGSGVAPPGGYALGPYHQAVVRAWLAKMEQAFSPIASWFK